MTTPSSEGGGSWDDNVAGRGVVFEMQLDAADVELTQHPPDALFDERIVGAVAGDEFLDNGPQCRGGQLPMGDAHGIFLRRHAKSIGATGRIK